MEEKIIVRATRCMHCEKPQKSEPVGNLIYYDARCLSGPAKTLSHQRMSESDSVLDKPSILGFAGGRLLGVFGPVESRMIGCLFSHKTVWEEKEQTDENSVDEKIWYTYRGM